MSFNNEDHAQMSIDSGFTAIQNTPWAQWSLLTYEEQEEQLMLQWLREETILTPDDF